MRCPDCQKEIRFNWESFCPHCSSDLKNKRKGRASLNGEAKVSGILWMRG